MNGTTCKPSSTLKKPKPDIVTARVWLALRQSKQTSTPVVKRNGVGPPTESLVHEWASQAVKYGMIEVQFPFEMPCPLPIPTASEKVASMALFTCSHIIQMDEKQN